jgi:hypothetical protein
MCRSYENIVLSLTIVACAQWTVTYLLWVHISHKETSGVTLLNDQQAGQDGVKYSGLLTIVMFCYCSGNQCYWSSIETSRDKHMCLVYRAFSGHATYPVTTIFTVTIYTLICGRFTMPQLLLIFAPVILGGKHDHIVSFGDLLVVRSNWPLSWSGLGKDGWSARTM